MSDDNERRLMGNSLFDVPSWLTIAGTSRKRKPAIAPELDDSMTILR
ncbi:MAG: hypothetical protein R6U67_00850 [Sodalinema sp.]